MKTLDRPHVAEELVEVRRHLHAHPELSMQEHATAALVCRKLEELGLDEIRSGVGRTGVLGTLRGKAPGPVTLLRAD
ncbi:MAG: amidohydrolase, partial [Candidatus Eremiobacteraeota bacterium]|nr:amidohydrolase [Candidatus Eremiobacteraeota bacterium]